ncbi:rhodanese-like domain-containing protein [Treponema sp. OttesenSCG-928-L16]|nr:rhodanese-like domain-containing protein [Treponema sp. OttesenSCG-928-L16]
MEISKKELEERVKAGALILDVRSPGEFSGGAYPAAINIPVDSISSRLSELEPKDRPIITYCGSGMRARRAAELLTSSGWTSVCCGGSLRNMP